MDDSTENNDLVPDSLLAFAKDHRYLEACQDLLEKVLVAPKEEAWWWSLLLYATLVVRRNNGTTLGMNFMGLQPANSSIAQRRLFHIALAAGWAVWARRCILRMKYNSPEEEEQRHEELRGAARQYFYREQRRAMMQRAQSEHNDQALLTRRVSSPVNTVAAHDATNDWMERMKKIFKRGIQVSEFVV